MNNTLNQLNSLRLTGMADALSKQFDQPHTYEELGFLERLSLRVNSEVTCRDNRKITRLLKQAKLRLNAQPVDIDYQARRGLSKDTVAQLLQFDWVGRHPLAHGDGSFGKLLTQLAKTDVLIIDDWGLEVLTIKLKGESMRKKQANVDQL